MNRGRYTSDFFQFREKGRAVTPQLLLELSGAGAFRTGPRFCPVLMTTITPSMGIFDGEQFEVFFPVGPFLRERRVAKTNLHPPRGAVGREARLLHVVQIFVAGDRTTSQRPRAHCLEQPLFAAGLNTRFDEISHGGESSGSHFPRKWREERSALRRFPAVVVPKGRGACPVCLSLVSANFTIHDVCNGSASADGLRGLRDTFERFA